MIVTVLVASLMAGVTDQPEAPSTGLAGSALELAVLPHTTLVGYPVAGRTPRALREAINVGRPSEPDGTRYDGKTEWLYSTRWLTNSQGICDPESAEVTVAITVILPELTTRDSLGHRDLERWDQYYAALVAHEHNHAHLALAGATAIQAAMRASSSCEQMTAAVGSVSETIAQASRTYDARTRHGRDEGAVYP